MKLERDIPCPPYHHTSQIILEKDGVPTVGTSWLLRGGDKPLKQCRTSEELSNCKLAEREVQQAPYMDKKTAPRDRAGKGERRKLRPRMCMA